jgi:2-polyprenyl-3-methyl-5-hydroxy-6-metoxy-1,4-benzoquinol methylase
MPTSHPNQLNEITKLIMLTNPKTILDVGVGFGTYGFLSREYLELWDGREKYHDWQRQIDGIEVFKDYITPTHEYNYNRIYIGEATKVLPLKTKYDLILLIDILEHFDYKKGLDLLEKCKKCAKNIIISTPLYIGTQSPSFGNTFETHKFQWKKKHFSNISKKFFLPNTDSLIIYIGTDASKIKSIVKKEFRTKLTSQIGIYIRTLLM